MESASVENQVSNEGIAVPTVPTTMAESGSDVVNQESTATATTPVEVEKDTNKRVAAQPKKAKQEEVYDDEEEDEPEPEEEEWVSEEEYAKPKKRNKRSHMSESESDEDYSSKRKLIVPIIVKPKPKPNLADESAGMKALRQYTSALKIGPRCFRGLNNISNMKEREATLISRLHACGRTWEGEYPSAEDIKQAKEETRQKKAEKARQFIISDDARTSRKAAQKAREFVKNLGDEDEPLNEDVDEEVQPDMEDRDEE